MEDDVFCMIINGEIPCTKVYEDEDVLAILDISQTTRGHTLVMPKAHYSDMLHCPVELMHRVYDVAQKIGQAQMRAFGAEGVNILSNVGEAAGQSVKHFHVHVIPRYAHETGGFQITMKSNNTKGWDLLRIATSIKEEF
jgi:histidine triad (HIT) family protein